VPWSGSKAPPGANQKPAALALILERRADVNQADSRGRTPIGILLTHRPVPLPQVGVLLKAGADVNALGGLLARTPLDYAEQYQRAEAAAFLLSKGARTVEQVRAGAPAPAPVPAP